MKRDVPLVPAAPDEGERRVQALAALFAALEQQPRAHDFFAVLRHVEALRPQWPRLGRALRPSQEALRLGEEPELDFAPAGLASFTPGPAAPRLGVRFFGLLGPLGPMPVHFTEYVRERLRYRGDATLARFLDLFHHRLLLLFYRAWAQAQPTVHQDRPDDDRFAAWLGAACGEPTAAPAARALPANARLFQAGLLGVAAGCGSKLRDRQYKFRIALGPLTLAQYHAFLPGGTAWPALGEWVGHYAGLDLRWDVQLTLARAQVPEPRLGAGVRLGVTTWIGRSACPRERGDLRLRPHTSFLLRPGGCHA